VSVQVARGDDSVSVEVTNHGAAIPLEEQDRIFERFYRSPSVVRQIPGSGLGLSIAHRIARAHHGDLTLASTPCYSTFRMTLPICHTPKLSIAPAAFWWSITNHKYRALCARRPPAPVTKRTTPNPAQKLFRKPANIARSSCCWISTCQRW